MAAAYLVTAQAIDDETSNYYDFYQKNYTISEADLKDVLEPGTFYRITVQTISPSWSILSERGGNVELMTR